jgi:uncharacterized protein (DUF1810 family)
VDAYELERFVRAQAGGTYARAVSELRDGRKQTHWMWFVFPQIAGLGQSATSRAYAISSLDEARAYLAHPLLGARLIECTDVLIRLERSSAHGIFGSVDAQKLRSSMTLFAAAAPENPVFQQVLDAYFDGIRDARTDELLARRRS